MVSRRALVLGTGAGVSAFALGRWAPGTGDPAVGRAAWGALDRTLSDNQRERIFLPWNHPSRQLIHNVPIFERPHLGTLLSAEQQSWVRGGFDAMLSGEGRRLFRGPLNVEAGGLDGCVLLCYGTPGSGRFQPIVYGGHVGVRDLTVEGSGSASYGHQTGNGQFRTPGNVWAFQAARANALFELLDASQRQRAVVPSPPSELLLQVQDGAGSFEGLPLAEADDAQLAAAGRLVDDLLLAWPETARTRARAGIERNGGLRALHVSYYADRGFFPDLSTAASREAAGRAGVPGDELPWFQVWRLEGPGMVAHFRGYPHVHGYLHVVAEARDQHVGPVLAGNETPLADEALRRWVEDRLVAATGTDAAHFPGAMPGRLPHGVVTEGTIWTLDPYGNEVVAVEIEGRSLSDPVRAGLVRRGVVVEDDARYRIAGLDCFVDHEAEEYGEYVQRQGTGLTLRETLVRQVRAAGRIGSAA